MYDRHYIHALSSECDLGNVFCMDLMKSILSLIMPDEYIISIL